MGDVYLWTGEGAGKTTSALGTALRAVGQGKKVVIIQFLKGRKDIGEVKIAEKLKPLYEIYQFGSKELIDPKNLTKKDYYSAKKGLQFAKSVLKKKPFLLILDEINLAVAWGLVSSKDVIDVLDSAKETIIYLTGRRASRELINRADFAVELSEIKSAGIRTRRGIEY